MSGLSAGLSAGGLFGAWLGSVGRIGGRRNRGVGGIPPGALAKFADLGLERFELFFAALCPPRLSDFPETRLLLGLGHGERRADLYSCYCTCVSRLPGARRSHCRL